MSGKIVVPSLGESVSEATVAKWFKQVGDSVAQDGAVVELETDSVTLEVYAPVGGAVKELIAFVDETVQVGALLGSIEPGGAGKAAPKPAAKDEKKSASAPAKPQTSVPTGKNSGPAVAKLLTENPQVKASAVPATGKDGRHTKGDILS